MQNLTGFCSLYGMVQLVVCATFTFKTNSPSLRCTFCIKFCFRCTFRIKFSPTWCLKDFYYIYSAPFMEFNEV